jgi:hypothetical protein
LNIYIDESGSINNTLDKNSDFIITLVVPTNKKQLECTYKRFVSNNHKILKKLDKNNKMFFNNKFQELKGSQFNKPMKQKFVKFFAKKKHFEIYYIRIENYKLSDDFCKNTARAFNYVIRLALQYLIKNNFLEQDNIHLQLDERNEKTETIHFLENYLNTELSLGGTTKGKFTVNYFDSSNNKFIQIADVFSNLFYSQLHTGGYGDEIQLLKNNDILKFVFVFPLEY